MPQVFFTIVILKYVIERVQLAFFSTSQQMTNKDCAAYKQSHTPEWHRVCVGFDSLNYISHINS